MRQALILATIGVALMLSSCSSVGREVRKPDDEHNQADAKSLLAKVRDVLPEGWEARLYWSPDNPELKPTPFPVDWLDEKWRGWLPGLDGRRIEVRRREAVQFWVKASGPNPDAYYMSKQEEHLRFALTIGEVRQAEEINRRLVELNNTIKRLEVVLKTSFYRREKDGYVLHSVPRDDEGRRALQEYDQLWAIKRWFPQWSEGNLSVGFCSLISLRMLPEEAKVEYRDVKKKVIDILHPVPGWEHIPADEE
jgi:hypothetical protein